MRNDNTLGKEAVSSLRCRGLRMEILKVFEVGGMLVILRTFLLKNGIS